LTVSFCAVEAIIDFRPIVAVHVLCHFDGGGKIEDVVAFAAVEYVRIERAGVQDVKSWH
jgi:hypothetical protein